MEYRIREPFTKEKLEPLRAGDTVFLTGTIYTARDAAHKRLIEMIENQEPLPFEVKDAVIYYVGPTPEKPGKPHRSGRPYNQLPDGRLRAYAAGFGGNRYDRKGTALPGGERRGYPKRSRLFRGHRRSGGSDGAEGKIR